MNDEKENKNDEIRKEITHEEFDKLAETSFRRTMSFLKENDADPTVAISLMHKNLLTFIYIFLENNPDLRFETALTVFRCNQAFQSSLGEVLDKIFTSKEEDNNEGSL